MAMMRAVDLVRRIAPDAPRQEYIAALDSGDAQLAAAGIDTPLRLAHLVAQCGGECGFTAVRESTHYTTLDNLLNIFHNRAMHLTQVAQFVVAGAWQNIRARCWSSAIGSRTMRRAGTISLSCGGRKGSAARYAASRIIGSPRGAYVTAGGAVGRPR